MTTHDETMEALARRSRAQATLYGESPHHQLVQLNEKQLLRDRAFALSQLISEGRGREQSQVYPEKTVAEEAAWTLHLLHVYKVL